MYVVSIKSKRSTHVPITISRSHTPSKSQLQSACAKGLRVIKVGTVLCTYKLMPMWPTAVAARQGSTSSTPRMPKSACHSFEI